MKKIILVIPPRETGVTSGHVLQQQIKTKIGEKEVEVDEVSFTSELVAKLRAPYDYLVLYSLSQKANKMVEEAIEEGVGIDFEKLVFL